MDGVYYIANEVRATAWGMAIAIDDGEWERFQTMEPKAFASQLVKWALLADLKKFKRHPRGPKKPVPKRTLYADKTLPEDLGAHTLDRAPLVWEGARGIVDHNIDAVKKCVRQEYSNEHPDVLAEIDRHVQKVDVIMDKLDTRLSDALARAGAAKDPAKRKTELAGAKTILADYIAFVKSEPLIDHLDNNPFGIRPQVRKTITDSLTHIIKSIA